MERSDIIKTVIGGIVSDVAISHPLYCPNLTSEEDCQNKQQQLPVVYIWNEDLEAGTFIISINAHIVAEALEQLVSRNDPSFSILRDEIMAKLHSTYIDSINNWCEQTGLLPSQLFSGEAYLEMVRQYGTPSSAAAPKESNNLKAGWLRTLMTERRNQN